MAKFEAHIVIPAMHFTFKFEAASQEDAQAKLQGGQLKPVEVVPTIFLGHSQEVRMWEVPQRNLVRA